MTPESEKPKLTDELVDALVVNALRTPSVTDPVPDESVLTADDREALDQVDFSSLLAGIKKKEL